MKTMKRFLSLLLACCMLLGTLALTSCGGIEVTFYVDGKEYHSCDTDDGINVTLPANPQKPGYTFIAWYYDEGTWRLPFALEDLVKKPLSSETSVYAYFVENGSAHKVTFDSQGGSAVETQNVVHGQPAREPSTPSMAGYIFCGWYRYLQDTQPYTFTEAINQDITLYAKWEQMASTQDPRDLLTVTQESVYCGNIEVTEEGKLYAIYRLGTRKNAIVWWQNTSVYFQGYDTTLTYEKSDATEESVSESMERSLSKSLATTTGISVGVEMGREVGVEGSVGVVSVSGSVSVSSSLQTSRDTTIEEGGAWSWGASKTSAKLSSLTGSYSFALNKSNATVGQSYTYVLLADEEVYQYFVYDMNTKQYTGVSGIYSSALPNAAQKLAVISDETGSFDYQNAPQLQPVSPPAASDVFNKQIVGTIKPPSVPDSQKPDGSKERPYQIATVQDLVKISDNMQAHYILTTDIDLSSAGEWNPIGGTTKNQPFNGSLSGKKADGGCYKITGLKRTTKIEGDGDRYYFGLFGYIGESGVVSDIILENVNISITSGRGDTDGSLRAYYAALAGYCAGTVENVTVSGKVSFDTRIGATSIVAGIVGCAVNAKINNAENRANIYSYRCSSICGGIVGYAKNSRIINCTNNGNITAKSKHEFATFAVAGGILGQDTANGPTTILNCTNNGAYEAAADGGWFGTTVSKRGNLLGGTDIITPMD